MSVGVGRMEGDTGPMPSNSIRQATNPYVRSGSKSESSSSSSSSSSLSPACSLDWRFDAAAACFPPLGGMAPCVSVTYASVDGGLVVVWWWCVADE